MVDMAACRIIEEAVETHRLELDQLADLLCEHKTVDRA
jgi:hypothetical protein